MATSVDEISDAPSCRKLINTDTNGYIGLSIQSAAPALGHWLKELTQVLTAD